MALASTTVFEARPGVGSATNGGGFVPGSSGTDWSQQNAAQYALTNGSATTGSATINTTSAVADMVGNITYVAGGTGSITGGWYQILSQVTGTSITLDRSTGLVTGTGVTLNIGGALDLWATAEPLLTAGMTLWIKATGTTTLTTNFILSATGDSTSGPITVAGYHTTRGDHDGTRPIFTSATNSVDIVRNAASSNLVFRIFDNLEISSTAGTPGNGFTGGTVSGLGLFWKISNCYIHGVKNGVIGDVLTYNQLTNLTVVNSEITGCTNDAVLNCDKMTFDGCYLHGNSGYGVEYKTVGRTTTNSAYPVVFRNTVVYSNSLGGIYIQSAAGGAATNGPYLDVARCVIRGNTNDGIQIAIANGKLVILALENNKIYGNSGYGVNITNAAAMIFVNRNNAYGSNTSGPRNNLAAGTNDVTLTADPDTNASGNDFTNNSTAGGGAACKASGFPGSIPGLAAAGFSDIGALQAVGFANILCPPRRVYVSRTMTTIRRFPGAAVLPPPVLISSIRKVR